MHSAQPALVERIQFRISQNFKAVHKKIACLSSKDIHNIVVLIKWETIKRQALSFVFNQEKIMEARQRYNNEDTGRRHDDTPRNSQPPPRY